MSSKENESNKLRLSAEGPVKTALKLAEGEVKETRTKTDLVSKLEKDHKN